MDFKSLANPVSLNIWYHSRVRDPEAFDLNFVPGSWVAVVENCTSWNNDANLYGCITVIRVNLDFTIIYIIVNRTINQSNVAGRKLFKPKSTQTLQFRNISDN